MARLSRGWPRNELPGGVLEKGLSSDPVLLVEVRRRVTLRRRGAPRTADVTKGDAARRLLEAVADRPPRAHVLRLLLYPHDLVQVRIPANELGRGFDRGRVELVEPRDGDAARVRAPLVPDDVV